MHTTNTHLHTYTLTHLHTYTHTRTHLSAGASVIWDWTRGKCLLAFMQINPDRESLPAGQFRWSWLSPTGRGTAAQHIPRETERNQC